MRLYLATIGSPILSMPINHVCTPQTHRDKMIARVIDILNWLDADTLAPAERLLRDQQQVTRVLPRDPFRRVLSWWQQVAKPSGAAGTAGARWVRHYHRLVGVLVGVGVIAGISAMAGVAVIDRGQPVNLLLVAAVFLLLPAIGWLLSVMAMIWRVRSTGVRHGGLFGADGLLNRWLERSTDFRAMTSKWPANSSSALIEAHLQMLPQWFTVGLFVGALLALVAQVIFTDLAFGWSTTIEIAAGAVHAACRWLAWPWSGWLPVAAPDLVLVEASRFFRLENRDLDRAAASSLGQWWPFVAMCLLVWGLLPRLLLMAVLHLQTRQACRQMLLAHPEVQALLERLQTAGLAVTATKNGDAGRGIADSGQGGMTRFDGPEHVTLVWNDCLAVTTSGDLPQAANKRLPVNVQQTDAQWESLAGSLDEKPFADLESTTIEVLVAGWEPPSLSLRDFLLVLNRCTVRRRDVLVVPVNLAGTGVDAADLMVWTNTLSGWGIGNVQVASRWSRP